MYVCKFMPPQTHDAKWRGSHWISGNPRSEVFQTTFFNVFTLYWPQYEARFTIPPWGLCQRQKRPYFGYKSTDLICDWCTFVHWVACKTVKFTGADALWKDLTSNIFAITSCERWQSPCNISGFLQTTQLFEGSKYWRNSHRSVMCDWRMFNRAIYLDSHWYIIVSCNTLQS